MIDERRTVDASLEIDDDTAPLARPLVWVSSFFSEREATPRYQVSREQVEGTIIELQGDDRTAPTEPTVELVEGEFSVVPGQAGRGVDPEALARSEEHTSELQSLMRISYAVFCLKKKIISSILNTTYQTIINITNLFEIYH